MPLLWSLSCLCAQELASIYSAAGLGHNGSPHRRGNEEQRMEKGLQVQAQPEINKLSAPAPRQAMVTES